MSKGRGLNPIDLMIHKRDFLWGKDYYGWFNDKGLVNTILYSKYYSNKKVLEIHKIEHNSSKLIRSFLEAKRKTRYFIRELNEDSQVEDIQFMQENGFRRFNRNYCFEFGDREIDSDANIICRDADARDLDEIYSIEQTSQILEYRDCLFKDKSFLKDNINDIYVIADIHNREKIFAYILKKESDNEHTFEFILHSSMSEMLISFINAFAERYLKFEKHNLFRFIINQNHETILEKLRKDFKLVTSSQLLVKEGAPKEKIKSSAKAYVRGTIPQAN